MSFEIKQEDPAYPGLLKEIHDPPKCLWAQGDCDFSGPMIAVVGARDCTAYGQKVAYEIAKALARAGVCVVSGLAYGIDTAAHQGALEGGGRTVAVLGCGIDQAYPARNQKLKEKIVRQGTVLSEFAPGVEAAPWTFPKRNRIVSGLSLGVVVVEAGLKSGSLITADFALQQGREVFAVPGPVTAAQSEGTNRLIQNGAKLVISVDDILDELGAHAQLCLPEVPTQDKDDGEDDENAKKILGLLRQGSKNMDDLLTESKIAIENISAVLVDLEIRGKIGSLPGGFFERKGM